MKFIPESVEGMTLGLFICTSIIEANGIRATTITLTKKLNSERRGFYSCIHTQHVIKQLFPATNHAKGSWLT
ncbi:MAG: hypothetical protein DLM72_03280 [Candidatus Nitrosopolaris wilkensis]|nr:MAG: hypothetical protein DLM72_03280 [Candidatus Nitrosopolaris wilkensis]